MASSSSRCSSLPRGMPLASISISSMLRTSGWAARKSRASWGLANCMVGSRGGAWVGWVERSDTHAVTADGYRGLNPSYGLGSVGLFAGTWDGQQLGKGLVEHGDQLIHVVRCGARAAQGHVVERGDQDAAVDQVQVQGHLQFVMECGFGLGTGLR